MVKFYKLINAWLSEKVPRSSLVLVILGTVALWLVDLGVVHWMNNMVPQNGFFSVDPNKLYHVGLYLSLVSLWLICLRR